MAANLRDPGSIPGGDPKRFQDSSNYVFYIVGSAFQARHSFIWSRIWPAKTLIHNRKETETLKTVATCGKVHPILCVYTPTCILPLCIIPSQIYTFSKGADYWKGVLVERVTEHTSNLKPWHNRGRSSRMTTKETEEKKRANEKEEEI